MEKFSSAQIQSLTKTAAASLRELHSQNQSLLEKVAHYEKKELAEKIASKMEAKGIDPEFTFQEKVSNLIQKDNLDIISEAVNMSASQTKMASIHEDGRMSLEGEGMAERNFLTGLVDS